MQIHLLGMGPAAEFLEKVLQPPPMRSIQAAVSHLQILQALSSAEQLTPLGGLILWLLSKATHKPFEFSVYILNAHQNQNPNKVPQANAWCREDRPSMHWWAMTAWSPGHHLAHLPVDTKVGKMLLLGTFFGCLSPVLSIAASLSYKSPFAGSQDKQESIQRVKLSMAAKGNYWAIQV